MSSDLRTKVKLTAVNALTGWDAAIYDAERSVEAAKARIEQLTVSIHRFKQFKEAGELFPGERMAKPKRKTRRKSLLSQASDL